MNREDRPTLAELCTRVHKERHREIGNWLARRIARPSAVYGTWLAVRLGLSAHQVTLLAVVATIVSSVAIGTGTRVGFVIGVALAHVFFWLDHVDGQVARWRRSASLEGVYLDYLMHHLVGLLQGFALGYGLAVRTNDPRWTIFGFIIALGWTFLGLSNDCRYKAIFQRLKRETTSFRVDGGSGGRPTPAPGWPRTGRGFFTWPAYKICEPHIVLMSLTILGTLAIAAPGAWLACLTLYVGAMAVMAPFLAIARIARAIVRGVTEDEFSRWFAPIESIAPEETACEFIKKS